jgi:hypothetical protein
MGFIGQQKNPAALDATSRMGGGADVVIQSGGMAIKSGLR